MGICISISVSSRVTQEKWEKVYEEALFLAQKLDLASRETVEIHGRAVTCLVPTRESTWDGMRGFWVKADYANGTGAESFFFPRELRMNRKEDDGTDILVHHALNIGLLDIPYPVGSSRNIWGDKTQGYTYHYGLLAVGCLVEDRLFKDACVSGDITAGQCREAVRRANQHLSCPIQVPCRCDKDRFLKRISALPLSEESKIRLAKGLYLGRPDQAYGDALRECFSKEALLGYWRDELRRFPMNQLGFRWKLQGYLSLGFGIRELCSLVSFSGKEGNSSYEKFLRLLLDAKLHVKERDFCDELAPDPEAPQLVGIETFVVNAFMTAVNNPKAKRYIPLEELKTILREELGTMCDTDQLIDTILSKEEPGTAKELSSHAKKEEEAQGEEHYDIQREEDLFRYRPGDTILPSLEVRLCKIMAIKDLVEENPDYKNLEASSVKEKLDSIARVSRIVPCFRDKDWEKIFLEVEKKPETFLRYLGFGCVMPSPEYTPLVIALLYNDALYDSISSLWQVKKENVEEEAE